MEVGPLARLLVAYASGRGEVKEVVEGALKSLGVPVTALFSTLGRTAARGSGNQAHRPMGEGVLRPTAEQHQERRHADVRRLALGPGDVGRPRPRASA